MNFRHRFALLLIAVAAITGCASTAPQKTLEQQLSEKTPPRVTGLAGKKVALNIEFRQKIIKSQTQGDDHEIRPVERIQNKDMYQSVVFQDARIGLKTNDQLEYFEQYLAHTLIRADAQIVPPGTPADLTVNAILTYGPMPAPAYQDFNLGKTLGFSLITLGFGPRSYDSVVDYQMDIALKKADSTIATHSEITKKSSEELKSRFNFNQRSDVQESAMESFRVTLQDQITTFAERINNTCGQSC